MVLEGRFRAPSQNLPSPVADVHTDGTDVEPFASVVEFCGSPRFLVPVDQSSFNLSWLNAVVAGDDPVLSFGACCTSKRRMKRVEGDRLRGDASFIGAASPMSTLMPESFAKTCPLVFFAWV
jgi:hypothetical protein